VDQFRINAVTKEERKATDRRRSGALASVNPAAGIRQKAKAPP
jgi:hypothetical protein